LSKLLHLCCIQQDNRAVLLFEGWAGHGKSAQCFCAAQWSISAPPRLAAASRWRHPAL